MFVYIRLGFSAACWLVSMIMVIMVASQSLSVMHFSFTSYGEVIVAMAYVSVFFLLYLLCWLSRIGSFCVLCQGFINFLDFFYVLCSDVNDDGFFKRTFTKWLGYFWYGSLFNKCNDHHFC